MLSLCLFAAGCSHRTSDSHPSSGFSGTSPVLVQSVDLGQQWPGWRGASLHGVSHCEHLPVQWNRHEGIRWRADVRGQGNSSPVVWSDHIYLTSQIAVDGADQLVVLCFDRQSGQELWSANLGVVGGSTHQKNGFASSTVATDGKHIVVFAGSRRLCCLDPSGNELWQKEFPVLRHEWGLAASPVIFRNLAVQVCDGQGESFVVAIDLDTGREVWRTARNSQGCWSTPVIAEVTIGGASRFELIVNGTTRTDGSPGEITAYRPQTGEVLWRVPCTTDIPCPTAIVGDGLVVSSSGGNGPIVAIRPGGHGDVSASCVTWRWPSGGPYVPTGIAYQDRLFIVGDSGRLTCHDLADGRPVWKQRLSGTFTASLVAGDGKIYATNERGEVYVFRAGDSFELLAANPLGERCLATPAIAHGELFLRTEKSLFCLAGAGRLPAKELAVESSGQDEVVTSMSDREAGPAK